MLRYILFLISFCCYVATAQDASREQLLSGFAEAISGEILSYWNFHPFAKQSLLTRCTTGEMAISWKTQPLPRSADQDTLSFLWIGAFSTGTSTSDHTFDFFINGERSLTFSTFQGGNYDNWSIPGSKGVALSYKHVWVDHVNDAHGYFFLRVPSSSFPAGRPLTLSVVGRKSESRDWYMTFTYAVKESAMVRSLPMLVREGGTLRQPIEISVDSPFEKGSVTIGLDGSTSATHPLKLGWNAVVLSLPAVERERSVPLTIAINSGRIRRHLAHIQPVRQRTIWLLPHSHNDIGYSDLQTTVLDLQLQNIRDALRLIEQSKEYPDGSRFKWNVEILWPVDSFFVKASEREKEAFVRAVKNGDIGLNALYVNPLTGIARPEALIHLTDFARELEKQYGLRIPAAMVSDIPGFNWSIVPALAQCGIRYFTSGPNAGDRIGHFAEAWGDKPFYWVGPSGKDSLLFWVAGTGYSLFHATRTFATNTGFLQKLYGYLERLDAADYPYDIVQMRYSIYSDNGMTDSTMSDFVREWNKTYASPILRIGTAEEMCIAFEKQYGGQLPSHAGDITPYWEDGAASTAAELGVAQRSTERLVQAEIATSMSNPQAFQQEEFADAWDAINLWIEHTWGAWNSVSDPDESGAVSQWEIKRGFVMETRTRSEKLLQRGMSYSGELNPAILEVINTSTWPRTDLVFLSPEESTTGDRVLDEEGNRVPSQRLTDGRLAFLAQSVPALGASRFALESGSAERHPGVRINGFAMENGFLRVAIDSATGNVQSIRDLSTGTELVMAAEGGVNGFIAVDGTDPAQRSNGRLVRLGVGEKGPLLASLISESDAPGFSKVVREVFLVDGLNRVDIRNTIDKKAVRKKEAAYFGFEFNVPGAITRLDLGLGYIRPEADQLRGSCKDFFSVQRWMDVSNPKRGITLATVEAPLVSLGGLVDERHHNEGPEGWKTLAVSSSRVYSWVMNNYWHTNYKADQEGQSSFQYSLMSHSGFDPVQTYRFGVERNQPLLVRRTAPSASRAGLPFRLLSTSVTATSVRVSPDGKGFFLRLYNPASTTSSCEIRPTGPQSIDVYECSTTGEFRRLVSPRIEMVPFEIRMVRIQ